MARKKKNEEEPTENQNNNLENNSDETFGLPEVEYEPLKRDQTESPVEPPVETPEEPVEEPVVEKVEEPVYEKPYETEGIQNTYQDSTHHEEQHQHYAGSYTPNYSYEPERPSVWPKVLLVGLLVLLAFGGVYYVTVYKPKQDAEREALIKEQNAAKEAQRKKREADLAEQRRRDAEQRTADSLAAIPKEGTLEVLSERTGQYYVVVASAIDDDLLTDFANKLLKNGKSVKIIPPFGKTGRFYRLAVDSKDTYADAQASADGMKGGDYGDQLWVVRY